MIINYKYTPASTNYIYDVRVLPDNEFVPYYALPYGDGVWKSHYEFWIDPQIFKYHSNDAINNDVKSAISIIRDNKLEKILNDS
jgi:hypothetical protein